MTGSGKIDKAPLRATAWEADDVWYAPTRQDGYRRMSEQERARLRESFIAAGRENVMPASARAAVAEVSR